MVKSFSIANQLQNGRMLARGFSVGDRIAGRDGRRRSRQLPILSSDEAMRKKIRSHAPILEMADFLRRVFFGALIALIALCPASMAENVQGSGVETVYLTEAARQILGIDLDESLYGAEEGVRDMRYVIMPCEPEDMVVGIRLRYPAPVELSAISVDTYEVFDPYEVARYSYCGLYVNDDGIWGHAETAGRFVFLLLNNAIPLREIEAAIEEREAEAEALWGIRPGCGADIGVTQTRTIWLANGSYVPGHTFFVSEGVHSDDERIVRKDSMIDRDKGCRRRTGRMCRHREWCGEMVERVRGP